MSELNKALINRAVSLWAESIKRPMHDNGDESSVGAITMGLAMSNMQRDMEKVPDLEKAIEAFKVKLTELLTDKIGGRSVRLSVDYNPSELLAAAADFAGVPHSLLSIKSMVTIHWDKNIVRSFGYGGDYIASYHLDSGDWLDTTLDGETMPKVIESINKGLLDPELIGATIIPRPMMLDKDGKRSIFCDVDL